MGYIKIDQNLYDKAKNIIKDNATMAFYNVIQQLYIKTDALGVSLGPNLMQARDRMWFQRNEDHDNAGIVANSQKL